ncbi:hypothetical protein [Ramlibacter tataouinensis]|uniref:hypothetical protein n=1 Tax=Ramlibacter tataouinensis TaxID=94132 RepID=UPI001180D8CB|nr:hypothetical protein [Ramlibacter tataouinensis]
MDRDIALRLDALLMGCRGQLDMAAHYMKNNLANEEFDRYVQRVGASMAELIEISNELHAKFPDIVPKELK